MSVFGLPFFCAGVFALLIAVGAVPMQNARSAPLYMTPLMLVMGTVFTLVGAALVFGRSWTTISSVDRTVVKQMGLLVPMSTKTYRIDDYRGVALQFVPGDSDTSDKYPVSLKGRSGGELQLFSSTEYAEARERAIAVAKLLEFDIEDSTTRHPVVMAATEADLSFQNRHRLDHTRDELIVRPAVMRSSVTDSNGIVTIVIPGRRHTTVTISAAGLHIDERRLWRTRTIASHSAADIIDVDYSTTDSALPASKETMADIQRRRPAMASPPVGRGTELILKMVSALVGTGGIVIKTRKGLTRFGAGLEDRELRYLHYIVRQALVR